MPFPVTLEFDDLAGCGNSCQSGYFRRARRNSGRNVASRAGKATGPTRNLSLRLQRAGKVPLQHGTGEGVGFLQVDAPIFSSSSGIRTSVTAQRT